jgi:DNA-binding transcriptional regulator YiaG
MGMFPCSMSKGKPRKRVLARSESLTDPLKADEFRAWRKTMGLTQGQAAKVFGVSQRTIENWEQDVSSPRPVYPIRKTMYELLGKRR